MFISELKSKVIKAVSSLINNSPEFAKPIISRIGDFTPVVGTTFSFVKTAKKVYASPLEAVKVGAKSVIIDCILSSIPYYVALY